MDSGKDRAVLVWHRRAGKDKVGLNFTVKRAFERVGTYYHIFPTFTQGRKVLWDGLDYDGVPFLSHFPPEIIKGKPNETEMRIELVNGSAWQVVGSDDIDKLRGTNPVGCFFSEYSYQNPMAWDTFRPVLAQNKGWAVFGFTPCGENHGHKIYEMARANAETWYHSLLTVVDTGVLTQADIDREQAEGMADDMIQQEFYCSFRSGASGAYYLKLMEQLFWTGHVGRVPWDSRLPVHTYWDLGRTDSTAIWFVQVLPREYRIIDYYESSGEPLQHYCNIIRSKPYTYGTHGAPADIQVKDYTASGSRLEIARGLGVNFTVVPMLGIEDGHNAVRSILPMCYFDAEACRVGIEHLRNYRKKWNKQLQQFEDTPVDDQHIHGADAFRYFAVDVKRLAASLRVDSGPVVVRTGLSRIDNRSQSQPRRWAGVN